MADIAVQPVSHGGITEYTYQAATTADKFSNNGRTILLIKTATTPTGTITVESVLCSHGRILDRTLAPAGSKFYMIGPFPPDLYNNTNSEVDITLDTVTDIEYAAIGF